MEDHEKNIHENKGGTAVMNRPEEAERIEGGEYFAFIPAVDIVDTASETRLFMDVPGVDKDGIDIGIERDVLTVVAKPAKADANGKKPDYCEYRVGDYKRSFSLSDQVNRDGITAKVRDGVLEITLPKAEPVTKKISVSAN